MWNDVTGAGSIAWTYDVGGRPKTETNPNGINLTYTYANDDTLTSLKIEKPASTTNTFTYTYDKNYRVKSQAFSGPGSGAGTPLTATFSYLYDDAGRLDSYTDNSGTQDVAYDVNGNRTTFGSLSWTYNADDSIASAKIPLGGLVGTIDRPYSYDPSGRLQNDGCQTSTYDAFDRLTSTATTAALNCPTGKLFGTYTYDALDRQLANPKDTAGSAIYDGNTQALLAGANNATYLLGPSGEPKGVAASATLTQYLHPDGQGSVGMTSNTTGGIACTSRFDPYGNAEPNDSILGGAAAACNTGTSTSEIFWRTTRQDGASGTYQFGARTYDPATATFLQTDTYRAANNGEDLSVGTDPLTRNTYSYVNGDPINLIDPSGHRAVSNDSNGQSDEQVAASMRRMASRRSAVNSGGQRVYLPSDYETFTPRQKNAWTRANLTSSVSLTDDCWMCMATMSDAGKGVANVSTGITNGLSTFAEGTVNLTITFSPIGLIMGDKAPKLRIPKLDCPFKENGGNISCGIGNVVGQVAPAVLAPAIAARFAAAVSEPASLIGTSYGKMGTVVSNPGITIKGFQGSVQPGHAINRIIERGVTPQRLLDALRNPRAVLQQAGNRFLYLTDDAAMVMTGDGQVVTAWTRNEFLPRMMRILRDAGGTP
ncbi:MAG TPA: RHS repeat-associated core domain-containing protein [Actinomycetota bacterium]